PLPAFPTRRSSDLSSSSPRTWRACCGCARSASGGRSRGSCPTSGRSDMWPWAVGVGVVAGLGLFLVVRELLPSTPRLQSALDRLSGEDRIEPVTVSDGVELTATQRYTQLFGAWAQRRLPATLLGRWG